MAPFGSVPLSEGGVESRVWAPAAANVSVRVRGGEHELAPAGEGVFAVTVAAEPGDDYLLVLDGTRMLPDPCSRHQPEGIRGPSRIVDTSRFEIAPGPELRLEELVLYELHVGTFTDEGTFDAAIPHLRRLRELGVTAVELMPVAAFPGERGWGYDGVYIYAPHDAYGGPAGLARFVDAAHREGLGVVLDVVYNHIGPGGDAIGAFGPYFTEAHHTFWGNAIDYSQRGVREWAIGNAELWTRDYRIDGLRLDAVHAIYDDSSVHVLKELRERVTGLVTSEHEGYYTPFGSLEGVVRELTRPAPERLIVCAQNHDQVGNRAVGDRLPPDAHRVALAVVLFSLNTPLLFMGEEHDETAPFQFFTDHIDPRIADATREGRKREFASFTGFSGEEVPDPQALETFVRSRITQPEPDPFYADLIRLRRELPRSLDVSTEGRILTLRRGSTTLVADFDAKTVELER